MNDPKHIRQLLVRWALAAAMVAGGALPNPLFAATETNAPRRPAQLPINRPEGITSETDPVRHIAVSADGRWLVYTTVGEFSAGTDLWLRSADPGRVVLPRQLTDDLSDKANPALSPDGRWVAYAGTGYDVKGDIYLLDLRGGEGTDPIRLTGRETEDGGPCFSPDGRTLYFHQAGSGETRRRVVAVDIAARGPVRTVLKGGAFPAVSPDGNRIAFVTHRYHPDGDIAMMDLASGEVVPLTRDPEMDFSPNWSPDGSAVFFSRIALDTDGDGRVTPGDNAQIFFKDLTPPALPTPMPITSATTSAFGPKSVGNRLFFLSNRGGGANCWSLPTDGEIPLQADAAAQLSLAVELARKVPPDPYLAIIAFYKVLHGYSSQGKPAAQAAHRMGQVYEQLNMTGPALDAYGLVEKAFGSVMPEAALARIAQTAVQTRTAMDRGEGSAALDRGMDRLSTIAAGSALPQVKARAEIETARLLMEGKGGASTLRSALERLDSVVGNPALERSLRAEAFLLKADAYAMAGLGAQAYPLYLDVMAADDPGGPWADRAVTRILERVVDPGGDLDRDGQVRRLRGLAAENKTDHPLLAAGALNRIGDLYFAADEWGSAKNAFREVLSTFSAPTPRTAAARLSLAEILYREERFSQALSLYETEIAARPYADDIYRLARDGYIRKSAAAGEYLFRLGEIPSARSKFKELIDYDPDIVPAHRGYIRCAAAMGDIRKVLADYRARMTAAPDDPVAVYATALCLTYLDENSALLESRALLMNAIALDGRVSYYHQTLGYVFEVLETVHGQKGQLELALESYKKAYFLNSGSPRQDPANRAHLLLNMGNASFLLDHYETAFQYYTRRLEADQPFDDPATEILFYRRLGAAAFQARAPEETLSSFEKAVALIDDRMSPRSASDVFGRITRFVLDRILHPLLTSEAPPPEAKALAKAASEINRELMRLTTDDVTPPPGDGWDRYEQGMTALMARQKALNPRVIALAETSDGLGETGRTVRETLETLMLRTAEALRFSTRLAVLKAEMMDRLGLAYQEAGEHEKAMDLFSSVYDLNERLGNKDNLARNRRSAAYNAYLLAGERTGKGRDDLLDQALTDFASVIELVNRHGASRPAERKGGGLFNIDLQVSLDEVRATGAAHGFTAAQEIRLAETFIYRIQTELGRLDPAHKALDRQLSQYPFEGDVPIGDRYGVALLHHRAGHLAQARQKHEAAFNHFRRSADLSLGMNNPVSSALNATNMARVLVDLGIAATDRMRDDLTAVDRRTTDLLARHPIPGDPAAAAAYHNRMGVHWLNISPLPAEGVAGHVARFRQKERAVRHFHQGLSVLDGANDPEGRNHPALLAALHLNLGRVALDLNEADPASDQFNAALTAARKGRMPSLEWRALAGLGRLEEGLDALRKVTALAAGCRRLEIVRAFEPLVVRRLAEEGPEAAFNLAEEISELERFNRMAFLLGEISSGDKARLLKLRRRLERIQQLRADAGVAEGEKRQYLNERLVQEKALLTGVIGEEGEHLPEIVRFSPDETTTETLLILLGLAAEIESAATADDAGTSDDARYADLIVAYQGTFRQALEQMEPRTPPGILALFGPTPVDAAAVQAALPPDGRLIRVFGPGSPDRPPVVFNLTPEDLTGEKGGGIATGAGDYIAADALEALDPLPGATAVLSGAHLVRCFTNKKPFRRSLLSIPPMDPPPEGYETGAPHHTVVISRPVDLFSTAPTRAGQAPQRFIGVLGEEGVRQRLETILSDEPDVSLAFLSDAAPDAGDLIAHLTALFGIPSVILAPDSGAEKPLIRDFLSAYLGDSASDALEQTFSEKEIASARSAGLIGYKGMTPAEASAFGKKRFAAYVKEGRGALESGHPARALTLLERAVRIAGEEVDAFSKYLPALHELSRESAYRAENLEKAIEHAGALTDLWASARPDSKEHAEAMLRLGVLYAQDENYAEAVPLLETASETLAALDLTPERAAALTNLGIALENATEYDRALIHFQSAASLSQRLGKDDFMARQQTNIGRIQDLRLSQYASALQHYGKALDIHQDLDQPEGAAQALLDMGRCHRLLGNFPAADRHYADALDLSKRLADGERLKAKILIEQANNAWYQARYQEAFGLQREAYAIAQSHDWPLMQVIARNTAGLIWWTLGDYEKALRELTTALETAGRLKARDDEIATTLNNMGQILREMGRYKAAMEKFDAALAIDERIASRWALAHDYRNKGLTLIRMGRPGEAMPFFQRAVEEAGAIGNRINEAKALLGLGEAAFQLENRDAAAVAWESALAMGRDMALREVTWRALYGLARIASDKNDGPSALDLLYQSIEVIEGMRADIKIEQLRDSFIANKRAVYETLVVLLADLGRPEAAFEVAERSRARNFIDLLGNQRLSLADGMDQELYERQAVLQSRIAEAEALLAQATDEEERALHRRSLAGLQDELSDLMLEIQARNPQLASLVSVSPLSAGELTGLLEPGVVLLAYYLTEDETLLWTVRADGLELIRTPQRRETLGRTILDYRRMIQNLEPLEETSRRLYSGLIRPAAAAIDGADMVGIIPHDALHYLSFATLLGPDGYVVEKTPLFYLPTASLLDYTMGRRTETRNPRVLAIGNPELDDPALTLPFAEHEVGAIGWNFPDITVLTEERATEAWVVRNISDFSIIHLASHGEFDPINPLFSSIKLAKGDEADGNLAAAEVFGLKINADMVVLSACQTGLGRVTAGDDVIGLNRAFFYAGTHAIVSSLWRVSDVSTAMLIKNFYRQYVIHRKAESLRRAILHVKQRYPHPGYWGAFTVVGDYY